MSLSGLRPPTTASKQGFPGTCQSRLFQGDGCPLGWKQAGLKIGPAVSSSFHGGWWAQLGGGKEGVNEQQWQIGFLIGVVVREGLG